jgi:hypothetical protein
MKIKKFSFVLVFLLSGAALVRGQSAVEPAAPAQNAAELESLLAAGEISFFQAAYFSLASAPGDTPESPEAAFVLARNRGWLPTLSEGKNALTLGDLSLLLVKAFNIEGSLMYRLFPGRRYAYREMVRRGFIEGPSYPHLKVSGERFLRILGRVLAEGGPHEQ